jgi:hypothetical protein
LTSCFVNSRPTTTGTFSVANAPGATVRIWAEGRAPSLSDPAPSTDTIIAGPAGCSTGSALIALAFDTPGMVVTRSSSSEKNLGLLSASG